LHKILSLLKIIVIYIVEIGKFMFRQGFLRRFRDPIRVPRISNRVPKIRENRVPRIRETGSLQIHTGFLTFSLKKNLV